MPRRRRKSRRNPFVFGRATADRETPGEMYEVYTKDEIEQLLTLMLAKVTPPASTSRPSRSSATPRPTARQTGRRRTKREPQRDDPIEWPQARVLGRTLGNMKTWCPNLANMVQAAKDAGREGLTRQDALKAMGITYGVAQDILDELSKYPLPDLDDPRRRQVEAERQAIAREMLAEAGFSCTVEQPAPVERQRAKADLDSALARLATLKF